MFNVKFSLSCIGKRDSAPFCFIIHSTLYQILLYLFLTSKLAAQLPPLEVGLLLGGTTYQGDLAEEHVEVKEIHPSFGAMIRYHCSPKLKLRAAVLSGDISGADANAEDPALRSRNWRFRASLAELSTIVEYHPFGKIREDVIGMFRPQVSPFLATGFGMARYDPLVTTGQRAGQKDFPEVDKKVYSFTLPLVAGITFDFSKKWIAGLEAGSRVTFHDHLDGVSRNGNPQKNDLFIFAGLSLTWYVGYQEPFDP